MQSHKDLNAWKFAIDLATDIYIVTKTFPKEELFAMVSQMRRAATSVSMNIAEGFGRGSDKDTIRFLYISLYIIRVFIRIGYSDNSKPALWLYKC